MAPSPKHDDGGPPRTCVVGAGPAGLAMARALLRHRQEFDCFERHSDVGGIWDQDNPGSPIYDSTHFISSRSMSGFHGFPMPKRFPDYPHHRQVLSYLREFAGAYGLRDRVTTSTAVERAEPEAGGGWRVTLATGELRRYDNLVCANGTTWDPNRPRLAGEFSGEIVHSSGYRSQSALKGKRVLVVGAGDSGVDIACDAAQVADAAWISMRRGYYVVPKHIFGTPADVFAESGPNIPMAVAQRLLPLVIRLQIGRQERYGLPSPDHRLFESHPIVNTQILHHLSHGDLAVKPGIERLEGDQVRFADGSREPIDLIIGATGYRFSIPYVDQELFEWKGGRPQLYMYLLSPGRDDLYAIGLTEGDGGAYALFDEMADLIASTIRCAAGDSTQARRLAELRRRPAVDVSGGVRHVASDRHAAYLHLPAYRKAAAKVRSLMGWGSFDPGGLELSTWTPPERD